MDDLHIYSIACVFYQKFDHFSVADTNALLALEPIY